MNELMLIPAVLLIPLFGGLVLPLSRSAKPMTVRVLALGYTLITFGLSVVLACTFNWSAPGTVQLGMGVPWISSFGLSFGYGVDSISLWLVLLTTFLMPLVVLGSFSAVQDRFKEFYLWLLVLEAAMLGVFVARDVVFFYVCFEFTLIPMFFLIGIFGSTQRLKAARVFFLYTFTGSMLTFAGVLYVAWHHHEQVGVWSFAIADLVAVATDPYLGLSASQQTWVLLSMLAGFAVKVPLFPFHTWLPLAHTEAPTAGSVVLAGVLLKLGTYALLRLAIPLTPLAAASLAPTIGVLAVIGILYTAMICWVQKDIKKLIAYSSVSHLGFCVLGMFALNTIGASGSVMYMINHGLSTGALFLCVGMIYERFHTREMAKLNGLARVMPLWSFFMVYFCLASVGLPGLNGFVGEFLSLFGAFLATDVLGVSYAVWAGLGMILAAMYILYMVGKVVFGPLKIDVDGHASHGSHTPADSDTHGEVSDLNTREVVTLVPLAVGCLVLGLYPGPMLDTLREPLDALIEPAARAAQPTGVADRAAPASPPTQPPAMASIDDDRPDRDFTTLQDSGFLRPVTLKEPSP